MTEGDKLGKKTERSGKQETQSEQTSKQEKAGEKAKEKEKAKEQAQKNQETQKATDEFSRELGLNHTGLQTALKKQEQRKNFEITTHTQQTNQDLEGLKYSSLPSTYPLIKESPLAISLGEAKAKKLFGQLDSMGEKMINSFMGNVDIVQAVLTPQQKQVLLRCFTIALVDGLMQGQSKEDDGIMGKFGTILGGQVGSWLQGKEGEEFDFTSAIGSMLNQTSKYPHVKTTAKRMQKLSSTLLAHKGKKELSLNSDDLLSWLNGSMDESQLQEKIIIDEANEREPNALVTKGKQLNLNPTQIELMEEMTQLAKQGSLLDEAQKEEQAHDMYHSMFGLIESVGSWFDISSPKQLLESMGMTSMMNLFLGWFGASGGIDQLHNDFLLNEVTQDFTQSNQKECIKEVFSLTKHKIHDTQRYSGEKSFIKKIAGAGITQEHELFSILPTNTNLLKDSLQEALENTGALPGIHLLQEYAPECLTNTQDDKEQKTLTIDENKFDSVNFVAKYMRKQGVSDFLAMLGQINETNTDSFHGPEDFVAAWALNVFSDRGTQAFMDGAISIGDTTDDFITVDLTPIAPPAQEQPSGQADNTGTGTANAVATSGNPNNFNNQGAANNNNGINNNSGAIGNATTGIGVGAGLGYVRQTNIVENTGEYHQSNIEYNKEYIDQLARKEPNINYLKDKEFLKYLAFLEKKFNIPRGVLASFVARESSGYLYADRGKNKTNKGEIIKGHVLKDGTYAKGLFQFTEQTGREYGLNISKEYTKLGYPMVDERSNPITTALAAAKKIAKDGKAASGTFDLKRAQKRYYGAFDNDYYSFLLRKIPEYRQKYNTILATAYQTPQQSSYQASYQASYQTLNQQNNSENIIRNNYEQAARNNFGFIANSTLPTYNNYKNHGIIDGLHNCSRSSRITKQGIDILKAQGKQTLICLAREISSEDRTYAQSQGIQVIYQPLTSDPRGMPKHRMYQICQAFIRGNVHSICNHGADRNGFVLAMVRKLVQGWTSEQALKELYVYNKKVDPANNNQQRITIYQPFRDAINTENHFGFTPQELQSLKQPVT